MNLLQRKVTALEARIVMAVEKETEWQSTIDRVSIAVIINCMFCV